MITELGHIGKTKKLKGFSDFLKTKPPRQKKIVLLKKAGIFKKVTKAWLKRQLTPNTVMSAGVNAMLSKQRGDNPLMGAIEGIGNSVQIIPIPGSKVGLTKAELNAIKDSKHISSKNIDISNLSKELKGSKNRIPFIN